MANTSSTPESPSRSVGGWTTAVESLLEGWQARAAAAQHAHYLAASRLHRQSVTFGLPVVILSTLVGVGLFVQATYDAIRPGFIILFGSFSVGIAILAALATFLRSGERAQRHIAAAGRYADIRRDMEAILAQRYEMRGDPKAVMDGIRRRLDKAATEAPELGEVAWRSALSASISKDLQVARVDKQTYTEKLEEAEGDDVFKYLVLISTAGLDGYIAQTRLQAEQSFRLSRVMAVVGFGLLSAGAALGVYSTLSRNGSLDAAYLSSVAGLLTEFISGIFVYLYNRTLQQLNRFHDRMISSQHVAISFLASTLVSDHLLTADLAKILMSTIGEVSATGQVGILPREPTGSPLR